jgi:hypothetical protein
MQFLIDEDVDVRVLKVLRRLGHDVKRVPVSITNGAVMRLAKQEGRVLITRDADFTDDVKFPVRHTPGIIHLDIHPPTFTRIAPPLNAFVDVVDADRLRGKLFVVTEEGFGELP